MIWSVRSYRRTTAKLSRGAKRLLLALRIVSVLLLGLIGLRPTLEFRREEEMPGVLLLGVDASASMARRDMPGRAGAFGAGASPVSRAEALHAALASNASALAKINRKAEVEVFTFADRPTVLGNFLTAACRRALGRTQPVGKATALGDALTEAFDPFVGKGAAVAGILLASDGCNNTSDVVDPKKLAELMGSRGVPIYTVGVGSERVSPTMHTLNVKELRCPDEIDAFNRLPIMAAIEAFGLAGQQVEVTCTFGSETVGVEQFVVAGDKQTRTVRFVHVPLASGFHRLTISARCTSAALVDLSGRPAEHKLVHVADREMRVLYVEGRFRYESKYITQAVLGAQRFSIDRRVLLEPMRAGVRAALSDQFDDWLRYHVVLFGDVDPDVLTRGQLEFVRKLVGEKGKGFCMIGGTNSFGRGWAGTPIADLLPVDPLQCRGQIDQPVKVSPTPAGLRSELMRVGPDDDVAAAWAQLGELPGANRLGGLKPAAQVLATTPAGEPLIVAQRYGAGRSLAIAFDTTYRWVLTPDETAEAQRRFWRQVMLYLAAPKGNVWIVTDRTSYDLRRLQRGAESVEVSAGVEDPHGRPMPDVPIQVTHTPPDNGQPVPVVCQKTEVMRRGHLPASAVNRPGVYLLRLEVEGHDPAERRFEVTQRDLEALDLLANHDLMREIAKVSGGKYSPLDGLGMLLAEFDLNTQPKKVPRVEAKDLAGDHRWPLMVAALVLLCMEWAYRKRKGLI